MLAGSVHAGHYQKAACGLRSQARERAVADAPRSSVVSLTAAGDDAEEWKELAACSDRFAEETGWTPGRVEQVAGAFKFADYGFFTYWAMRWIARQKDQSVAPHENREYTDWKALDRLIGEWTAEVSAGK